MEKKSKDILRYIILLFLSAFALYSTIDTVDFVKDNHKELSIPIITALSAINSTILGLLAYWLKKFTETSST